ncbi:hypothetical protein PPERSA_09539 [Pseudocohnilembus persalinus]|uniref:Ribosomal protein eL8/eL30/eS12/Gadd45 domain-containing protein n=1 Tax=Pseudocohnilembus persalinus TaxID=266149 RepID=A0A0V0QFK6_PSEPJ|nr:hypothetical protein PPERSA_09539 [Pseudocohnilembus persalinus]|eukprot:KRX00933.1 hypothetical protein PPERSA_09539 [Pseudocohnilembus persalinus]
MDQDKLVLFNQILKKLEEDHFKKYQKAEIDMENINIEKDYDLNTISYDQLKQIERQQEKRKFRQQLKNKRKLDSVVRIAKEVYKYRKEKQLPKPQKSKKKYKAVPANTLEFEVEERKKHKKSKVKEALQKYQQIQQKYYLEDEALREQQKQQNEEKINQLNQQQLNNQEQINSNYETVAEMTENEQHIIKVHKNFYFSEKNYLKGQKYNGMELQGIVAGFNEVQKSLALNLNEFKSKLVILALNNKETPIEGGTNEYIAKILEKCQQKNIPLIHASSRARLGKC